MKPHMDQKQGEGWEEGHHGATWSSLTPPSPQAAFLCPDPLPLSPANIPRLPGNAPPSTRAVPSALDATRALESWGRGSTSSLVPLELTWASFHGYGILSQSLFLLLNLFWCL